MPGVAACLFVRNAEHDIQEWIAYHSVLGINAFLIYDNGSDDATVVNARAMNAVADVRIIPWGQATGKAAQNEAYEHCFRQFQREFEWILVIDSDEYLSNADGLQIESLLSKHFFHAEIAFNWACFGSNGHIETPTGLTIEAFTRRSNETFAENNHTKCMVRPELAIGVLNPHHFDVKGPVRRPSGQPFLWNTPGRTRNIDLSNWKINHYFVRSYAQWEAKLARGYRDSTQRDKSLFHAYDRNEVLDEAAAARADEVRLLLAQATGGSRLEQRAKQGWFARVLGRLRPC